MVRQHADRHLEDVGHDLHPDQAFRATIGGVQAVDRVADLAEHLGVVAQGVADGFQRGAPEVAGGVVQAEAREGGAGQRVVQRRFLAERIGQDREALAAGWDGGGELVEAGVGLFLAGGQDRGEPVQHGATAGHAAVGDKQARDGVVVEVEAVVRFCLGAGHEDVGGAAELQQHVALRGEAGGVGAGDVVGAAGDDLGPQRQAGGFGGLARDLAEDRVALADRRDQGGIDAGQGDELGGGLGGGEVQEAGFERPVALGGALAGEAPGDVVVGAGEGAGGGEGCGFVAGEPAQLGGGDLLVEAVAGGGEEGGLVGGGEEFGEFHVAAGIRLLDAGAQGVAVGIQEHQGREHAGDADAGQGGAGAGLGGEEFLADFADVLPPLARIGLGPARMRGAEGGGAGGKGGDAVRQLDQDADGGGGADVEADGEHGVCAW